MKKCFIMIAVCSVLFVLGCNDEIKVENRTFKNLCQMSGGEIDPRDNSICVCFGKPCSSGIVCINNGEFCADTKDICDQGHLGDIICKNNSKNEGFLHICQHIVVEEDNKSDEDNKNKDRFSFEAYHAPDAATMTEYNVNAEGACNGVSCNGNLCGECQNGTEICGTKYGKEGIFKCQDGVMVLIQECSSGSCKADVDGDGAECGDCFNGEERCVTGTGSVKTMVQRCVNAQWPAESGLEEDSPFYVKTCDNLSCNADMKDCGVCLNGDTKCEGGILHTCMDGGWSEGLECPNHASCLNDGKECGTCQNDETKCEDENGVGKKFVCDKGLWVKSDCDGDMSCNLLQTSCGVCKNGSTKCDAGLISTCVHGEWSEGIECPNHVSCMDEEHCGVCRDNDERCVEGTGSEGPNGKAKIQTCTKGKWDESNGELCLSGGCDATKPLCAVCKEGDTKCVQGTLYQCMNNVWTIEKACGGSCKNTNECGFCYDGVTKCEADPEDDNKTKLWKCESGDWIKKEECECNPQGTACAECIDGQTRCITIDNDRIAYEQSCFSNKWSDAIQCAINACDGEERCAECENGQTQCFEKEGKARVRKCEKGKWGTETDCAINSCTPQGTGCAECEEGNTRCQTDEVEAFEERCIYGKWSFITVCADDAGCNGSNTKCAECKNEETRCAQEKENAYELVCESGEWVAFQCKSKVCNNFKCADCSEDEYNHQCSFVEDKMKLSVCSDFNWKDSGFDCSEIGEQEMGAMCDECYKKCIEKGICNSDG